MTTKEMTKQISKDIFKDLQLGQQAQEWWLFDFETLEKVPEGLKYTHNLHKEALSAQPIGWRLEMQKHMQTSTQ